ncbi:hypothetical protein BG28_01600 [Nesterenkonia sp. AN1]|uniref:hypothetical protein n=1 Tax=Nesterenkonia sp. AN1 TaxID=652017 RepID=UPI000448CE82|nr:hypothetical protein [Nesterenkonia sp. AN1]EXF26310.1 hypothetical protein BG28_01600 [Nesterenkonia sp. AN1]
MASPGTRPKTTTAAGRGPRALLLIAAALNLLPAVAFSLLAFFILSYEQFSLVAGTGSLAAAICTLYALYLASLRRILRVFLGGVALLAAVLFIGGDALLRAMPSESIGPGLVPLMGLLLHLSAAVTLLTLGLIYQTPRTSPRRG